MKNNLYILLFSSSCIFIACSKGPKQANCVASANADCICSSDYAPVCGCDDNTYSNNCAAQCAGVEVISQGKCKE